MFSTGTGRAERTQLRSSLLTVSKRPTVDSSIVPAGTSLLDVMLRLSGHRQSRITVIDNNEHVIGFLATAEFEQEIEAGNAIGDLSWKTRSIESLLLARLQSANDSVDGDGLPSNLQPVAEEVPCQTIVEDGSLLGLITDTDVFVSLNRIEELLSEATLDQLSGLMNRAAFMQRCREELERSNRTGVPLVLVLFDMDEFKQINDLCGHPAGDKVIQQISECIYSQLRSYDVVGRLGGDEFAALCCQCQGSDIGAPIRRIQAAVSELIPPSQFPHPKLTLSIGAASVNGTPKVQVTDLYAVADECLYAAKRAGRNCAYHSGCEQGHTPNRVG